MVLSRFIQAMIMATKPLRYQMDNFLYARSAERHHMELIKDTYRGSPMLIVGNGPSLNRTPLEQFHGVPSIGMNKIDLIYGRSTWRPSLVICANNIVIKQNRAEFRRHLIPTYLAWKARWLMRNKPDHIHYFDLRSDEDFQVNAVRGFGMGVTVTYAALQMAYYLGADPVIIVGVDHNFDKVGGFGAYERRQGDDNNHFDPNYFKKGTVWGLPNLEASEALYVKARDAYVADGRKIFDATVDGKLDIFPKISIDEALSIVQKQINRGGET